MSAAPATFLDTGVLLRSVDDPDATRRARARAWIHACWTRRCGRTSVRVLEEFYAQARRRFTTAISAGDARAMVRRYQHWQPWQADQATVETAWAVESRYGFGWWESLVIAAAQHQRCRYLVSDDLPHGLQVDSLLLVGMDDAGPEILDGEPLAATRIATVQP